MHHHLTKKLTAEITASSGGQNIQLQETILMVMNCLLVPVKGYKANSFNSYKAVFTLLDFSHLSSVLNKECNLHEMPLSKVSESNLQAPGG